MPVFETFPYTNFHDLNLDWILKTVKANSEFVEGYADQIAEIENKINTMSFQDGVVNVKFYGARGDGETNDIEAFKKAVAVAVEKGMPVYVPAGDYLIGRDNDSYYPDAGIVITSPLAMFGDGFTSRIIGSDSDPSPIHTIYIRDTSDVIIRDICIDGGLDPAAPNWDSSSGVHGIRMQNCSNILFDHVKIQNCYGYAIGAQRGTFQNITIINCEIDYTGRDGIDFKNYNSDNRAIKIIAVTVRNIGMNSLLPEQHAQACIDIRAEKTIIIGCHCLGITGDRNGIRLRETDSSEGGQGIGGQDGLIIGCVVTGSDNTGGIGITLDESGVIDSCVVQRMNKGIVTHPNFSQISNTRMDRCGDGLTLGEGYGVHVVNCIFTSMVNSVKASNTNAAFFTDCTFSGASTAVFTLSDTNKIYIAQCFARGTIGTQFSGTTTNVHITNCENIST